LSFCLAAFLLVGTQALALDKKASVGLSHHIMGVIYEDLRDMDAAIREYKEAIKADPENCVIRLNLASVYIKKNDLSAAIEELKSISRIDPQEIQAQVALALIYSLQGRADLASSQYEIALKNASKLKPEDTNIYKNLGAVYLQQKKFKEAKETYRLVLSLSPKDAQAHFYLGSIYNELKENELAKQELRRALELAPDYDEALNFLGYLYVEEGYNLNQAELMIKNALKIEPDNGAYIDSLGWLYFKQSKFQQALAELKKAASLTEDPVIYDHLGDTYLKLDNIEKARLNWQRSLELEPGQGKVKEKLERLNKN
jgi:Tfp pilus assembly protein PilF